MKSAKDVELAIDQAGDNVAADADSEDENLKPKAKLVKYSKDKGVLEEDLQYKEENKEVNSKYLKPCRMKRVPILTKNLVIRTN